MGDSSSFSSLFALVDNHLSKTNLQQENQPSISGMGSFQLPTLNRQRGLSDTGLASSSLKFPMPSFSMSENPINNDLTNHISNMFSTSDNPNTQNATVSSTMSMSDCPINDILAIQLSNMFKAKEEKKRKEEQKIVEENLQKLKLEESSCLIDLMPAVQLPGQFQSHNVDVRSSSSSMESLLPEAPDSGDENTQDPTTNLELLDRPVSPLKPIIDDMSYILKHKLGKCSPFGKVLCARYRPVAAPYFKVHVPLRNIKVFDFLTPSPDDIIAERLKKPSFYNNSNSSLSVFD